MHPLMFDLSKFWIVGGGNAIDGHIRGGREVNMQ